MTDKALVNAEARRAALVAEIEGFERALQEKRDDLERVEAFIRDWHAFAASSETSAAGDTGAGVRLGATGQSESLTAKQARKRIHLHAVGGKLFLGSARQRPSNPRKEEVAEAARDVIRQAGHPMIRPDLMRALRERGVFIEGTNPDVVLSTMLHRTVGLVKHLKGFGYWLHDEPYPPADYIPGQTRDHPPASQKGSDMTDESAAYENDERVEARRSGSGPWEKGRIATAMLDGTGWMVQFGSEHGTHPIPAARIRRLADGPSDGGG